MGLKKEKPPVDGVEMVSFTEPTEIIVFNEARHTYHHGTRQLKSGTAIVKDYEDHFDADRISAMLANKHGVDQQDLLDMWSSNGKAASMFGTSIHYVMEHYYRWRQFGEDYAKLAGKDKNAAMPNHPFLQDLIAGLDAIRTDTKSESVQEALVTIIDKGICGLADEILIIDRKKKICRLSDYKITFDITVEKSDLKAPFTYLGGSKLSKNYLQMAVYGYMLSLAGWTVTGADIYNWDGEWHVHTIEGTKFNKTMALVGSRLI